MTDTEKLEVLRQLHETWGNTPDADALTLWEDMGFILGTLKAAIT